MDVKVPANIAFPQYRMFTRETQRRSRLPRTSLASMLVVEGGKEAMRMGEKDAAFTAQARANDAFRRELLTGAHSQLVAMAIPAGGEIGEEVHPDVDQTLMFIEGEGEAILEGERSPVRPEDVVFVKAGTRHNFVNTGAETLRLLTIYAPPEHAPGTVHLTKQEADAAEGN
jgi:mannose-6-phosphate isomerase-like protein (cupin superfamily)